MKKTLLVLCIKLSTLSLLAQDVNIFHGLSFRNIGPAGMSGRVSAIDVVNSNNSIIYAGSSAGSLWKSENAGIDFKPMFEGQKTASIGDIAIYQNNPEIVYIGTGEGNPRNTQAYGYGVYKTLDGGKTWQHLGLEGTRNIHRVIVHPNNPDVVWVGAQGSAWGTSEDRGVYKTVDGGKSWDKILYVNESTGVADMVIDPSNPNKLIVAMWEFRRQPWTMFSGGEGSGIHITTNGGETWNTLTSKNGLPEGILGRIGLAIAQSNTSVVYANIESEKVTGMYRSNNGGTTWQLATNQGVGDRPFYYNDVEVDPTNENRVYHIATTVSKSEDGGKSFTPMLDFFGGVHSDHHAFWINPNNPKHILDGNDGGIYATYDMGKEWRHHKNLPVGQFYHINVDSEIPYNVYGGMQDNGSWYGPAYKYSMMGMEPIFNDDFKSVGFGDGFDVIPDPEDNRYGYSMSQGGEFQRYDRVTGIVQNVKPQSETDTYRFNWNAALAVDPFTPSKIYGGSQYVHISMDKGLSWEVISPDLTTNDPEKQKQYESGGLTIDNSTAENHTTITVIEPSSLQEGLIWVGTDDGNLQLSQDGGETWVNLIKNIRGVPENTWITQIKHSTYNAGEAFVVFDDHRRNNWAPYVYHTENYGRSWERIVDEDDVWGYSLSFVQDPVEPNLMFTGTEFGLYVSFDGAKTWQKWKADFPTVSTMDAVIHPTEHDLVIATFGRSIYVLDDIRPLREMASSPEIAEKDLHLFDLPHSYQAVIGFPEFFSTTSEKFKGQNRVHGALISFYAKEATEKNGVKIEILDEADEVIRTLQATAMPGVNRTSWDLKTQGGMLPGPPDMISMFLMGGSEVIPGNYQVRISIGEWSETKPLEVRVDPKTPITMEQFQTNIARKKAFLATSGQLLGLFKQVDDVTKAITRIEPIVQNDSVLTAEVAAAKKLVTAFNFRILPAPNKNALTSGTSDLKSQILAVAMYYFNTMVIPDENSEIMMRNIQSDINELAEDLAAFNSETIEPLKEKINSSGIVIWE